MTESENPEGAIHSAPESRDLRVERQLADRFRRYLQARLSRRYSRPHRLDVPGRTSVSDRQADFLLRGEGCNDAVLELKRLTQFKVSVQKKAEARVRKAVADALELQGTLPAGYLLVVRSNQPVVPTRRSCEYDRFLDELRTAFRMAAVNQPYESVRKPEFGLCRFPTDERPFEVWAPAPRKAASDEAEFQRLRGYADTQIGSTKEARTAEMRILLLVVSARLGYELVQYWLWRSQPRHITHMYSVEVCAGLPPYLLVSGLWPSSNGVSEKMCDITARQARCFLRYARGGSQHPRLARPRCRPKPERA